MTAPDIDEDPRPFSGLTFDVTVEIPEGARRTSTKLIMKLAGSDWTVHCSPPPSSRGLRLHRGRPSDRTAIRSMRWYDSEPTFPGCLSSAGQSRCSKDEGRGRWRRQGAVCAGIRSRRDHVRDLSDVRRSRSSRSSISLRSTRILEPGKSSRAPPGPALTKPKSEILSELQGQGRGFHGDRGPLMPALFLELLAHRALVSAYFIMAPQRKERPRSLLLGTAGARRDTTQLTILLRPMADRLILLAPTGRTGVCVRGRSAGGGPTEDHARC